MFFVFILMFVCCDGFLIDTTNPPGTGQYMTDKHYKALMDLFFEERQARLHLEYAVTQLQHELVKTQTAVGNKLLESNKYNKTIEQYVKELKNKTEVLDIRLFDVESDNIQLKTELNSLRKSHSELKVQYNQIKQNYASFENKTHYFDTEIQSLKQLKSVTDLQAVFRISNQTDHLEHELQNTNSQIVVLQSSDNARKQDFLALYNKTMVVEQSMNNQFQSSETINKARIQKVAVDVSQNSIKVAKALDDITAYNQRTAVSLYPVYKTYSSGSTIMFNGIRSSNGLNSTRLANIRNKGYFTCDNDGLYRISVSLMTKTAGCRVDVFTNNSLRNHIYAHNVHDSDFNTMTFDSLERLSKGDTIILKAGSTVLLYGSSYSVLSVLQITT
ncbi:CAP-Gly domain-containing linker protein 1-like [Mytilus trossulus]|uniref:CAP-Gly domain-containing linker protein 1-like n=1 Tax=Mytilus trossulus TaxID=6551 RepID=UPI003003DD6A